MHNVAGGIIEQRIGGDLAAAGAAPQSHAAATSAAPIPLRRACSTTYRPSRRRPARFRYCLRNRCAPTPRRARSHRLQPSRQGSSRIGADRRGKTSCPRGAARADSPAIAPAASAASQDRPRIHRARFSCARRYAKRASTANLLQLAQLRGGVREPREHVVGTRLEEPRLHLVDGFGRPQTHHDALARSAASAPHEGTRHGSPRAAVRPRCRRCDSPARPPCRWSQRRGCRVGEGRWPPGISRASIAPQRRRLGRARARCKRGGMHRRLGPPLRCAALRRSGASFSNAKRLCSSSAPRCRSLSASDSAGTRMFSNSATLPCSSAYFSVISPASSWSRAIRRW